MVHHDYFRWIRMATAAVFFALAVIPAQAQYFCDRRDDLVARLAETFHERRVASGLAGDMWIAEVFVSARGTWTLLMTDVQGMSCIVAAGDGWETDVAVLGEGT